MRRETTTAEASAAQCALLTNVDCCVQSRLSSSPKQIKAKRICRWSKVASVILSGDS